MKSITKKILTLSLLIPLAGCWDSGCCKKNKKAAHVEQAGHQATSKEHCSHAGCTHDHSHDAHKDFPKGACEHAGCTENHTILDADHNSVISSAPCANAECAHHHHDDNAHVHHNNDHNASHHDHAASEHHSDEK